MLGYCLYYMLWELRVPLSDFVYIYHNNKEYFIDLCTTLFLSLSFYVLSLLTFLLISVRIYVKHYIIDSIGRMRISRANAEQDMEVNIL